MDASVTNNIVDARFIAIVNTALESPLGQVDDPHVSLIAKNAPNYLQQLSLQSLHRLLILVLSANALGTKYLNEIFIITREVKDKITGQIQSMADHSELGMLLIVVTLLTLIIPIITVWLIQSLFHTKE